MKIKLAKSELIHFVGIGGIGMSGLSLIMKGKGFNVQGSDTPIISLKPPADAFGASKKQTLWGVQIPLALPNIMQGINQCTMMSLAMVVIASMIGTRGIGDEVLLGLQQLNVGMATDAGIAIVLLAIIFDRITQSYGERIQERTQKKKKI